MVLLTHAHLEQKLGVACKKYEKVKHNGSQVGNDAKGCCLLEGLLSVGRAVCLLVDPYISVHLPIGTPKQSTFVIRGSNEHKHVLH